MFSNTAGENSLTVGMIGKKKKRKKMRNGDLSPVGFGYIYDS